MGLPSANGAWSRNRVVIPLAVVVSFVALVVYSPWHPAGFVSDSWYLLSRFGHLEPADVLARFIPSVGQWYRPLTDAGFWLTWQLFGLDPTGHFLVHLGAHVIAAFLLAALVSTLTGSRIAAVVGAASFLFALQAHEVVWDVSALHLALVTPVLIAAVLAYVRKAPVVALVLCVTAMLVDEAGVLVLPLLALYELVFRAGRPWRPSLIAAARRLAPVTLAVGSYLVIRIAIGGGFYNEVSEPCRTAQCVVVAGLEYMNRLTVRQDTLLSLLWEHRLIVFAGVAVVGPLVLLALRPWRWTDPRAPIFGFGWAYISALFFALALWPYIADRFVYIPAIGTSIVIGGSLAQVERAWPDYSRWWRTAAALVGVLLVVWLAQGGVTLFERGQRWVAAGDRALQLARAVNEVVPAPAPGTVVLLYGMPRFLDPIFPPGNTGPYVFLNGMASAMRLLYGWEGVLVPPAPETYSPQSNPRPLVYLQVSGDAVTPLNGPP